MQSQLLGKVEGVGFVHIDNHGVEVHFAVVDDDVVVEAVGCQYVPFVFDCEFAVVFVHTVDLHLSILAQIEGDDFGS